MKEIVTEKQIHAMPGLTFIGVNIVALGISIAMLISMDRAYGNSNGILNFLITLVIIALVLSFKGLIIVNPNEAKVLLFYGNYVGTLKKSGLHWINPFFSRIQISTKIRNFESPKLKVNDLDGNPVEIAAIIVWQVIETAEAIFQIDDFENYVRVQSESAIRNLTMRYSYDAHKKGEISLHGNPEIIKEELQKEVQERLTNAGVQVIEARISHLAYAQEIASAMLQRQQANAIISARAKIVDGAVGMVELALKRLAQDNIVILDEERKAAMVSNLLVVLCGDRTAHPIINAGSIY
jgi:regulator of protease activity HflC (stomatin/prohibitin superfamily)